MRILGTLDHVANIGKKEPRFTYRDHNRFQEGVKCACNILQNVLFTYNTCNLAISIDYRFGEY